MEVAELTKLKKAQYLTLLEKQLKKAKRFAFYKDFPLMDGKISLLILSPKEIPKSENEAAKSLGATRVDKGDCIADENEVVFHPEKWVLQQKNLDKLGLEGAARVAPEIRRIDTPNLVNEEDDLEKIDLPELPPTPPNTTTPWQRVERQTEAPRQQDLQATAIRQRRQALEQSAQGLLLPPLYQQLLQQLNNTNNRRDITRILNQMEAIQNQARLQKELKQARSELGRTLFHFQSTTIGSDQAKSAQKRLKVDNSSELKHLIKALAKTDQFTPERLDELETLAKNYIQLRQNNKKSEGSEKLSFCFDVLADIRFVRTKLKHPDLSGYTVAELMGVHAELLLTNGKITRPEERTGSDSFFLRDSEGAPKFIFKPQDGEEGAHGFPKGGGAPREVLFSRLNDKFKTELGLDFGVCTTTTIELDRPEFLTDRIQNSRNIGALQQLARVDGDLESTFGLSSSLKEDEKTSFANLISQDDVDKVVLLDLLTLNLDRNPGNLLFRREGETIRLIPIDAGNSLPSVDTYGDMSSAIFGGAITKLPQVHRGFSPKFIQVINQLDPQELGNWMQQAFGDMCLTTPGMGEGHDRNNNPVPTIGNDTFSMVERSARFLKAACSTLTHYELIVAYSGREGDAWAFLNVVQAPDNQVDNTIQAVILAAKQAALETRYRDLGGDPRLIQIDGDTNAPLAEKVEALVQFMKRAPQLYATAGGDEYVLSLGGSIDDRLIDKLLNLPNLEKQARTYNELGGDEALRRYGATTNGLLKDRLMVLQRYIDYENLGGDNEVRLKGGNVEDALHKKLQFLVQRGEYEELGGDEAYRTIRGELSVPLIGRIELLKIHAEYEELGGDVTFSNKGGDPTMKLRDRIRFLKQN